MSFNHAVGDPRPNSPQQIEDALFEALCRLHRLSPEQALPVASLAASAIGVFLGDLARLDPCPRIAAMARAELASVHEDCARLLSHLSEQGV